MKTEFQLLIYGEENDILSSSHFDKIPSSMFVNASIQEDNGIRAEIHEVEYPSEISTLICEFY
jgi:hypothetical protein